MPNKFFPKCLISNIESPFSRWICESARRPKQISLKSSFRLQVQDLRIYSSA